MKYLYLIIVVLVWFSFIALIGSLQNNIDNASKEYAKYLIEQTK